VAEPGTSSKQGGLTRAKAILIGVLAVVLVVILYVQFGSSGAKLNFDGVGYRPPHRAAAPQPASATANPATAGMPPGSSAVGKSAAASAAANGETIVAPIIDETRWKSPQLAAVIAYDPFALPAAFPQPPRVGIGGKLVGPEELIEAAEADDAKRLAEAVEKLRMQLEELKQRGVHVIVREHDKYAAMIGDRMLYVGDEINGFTVTAIDTNGVHVERKESP
jgi:hypothetical protein